jgi:hypothetical protein
VNSLSLLITAILPVFADLVNVKIYNAISFIMQCIPILANRYVTLI